MAVEQEPEALPTLSLPTHVAIIMDGNGRWAKERSLPRIEGHRAGVNAVRAAIESCVANGIRYLTLYSFSTENWHRSEEEVSGLMGLFYKALTDEAEKLVEEKIRLRAIGDLSRLPENVQDALSRDIDLTEHNSVLTLTLAVSYGAREELLHAARSLAQEVAEGRCQPEDIDAARFASALWTRDLPDPDLLIRTSGEMRISNFLLWQLAYAEIIVIPEFWPDCDRAIFERCYREYAQRERRFGRTSEQVRELHGPEHLNGTAAVRG